jgi:hypothetical protein
MRLVPLLLTAVMAWIFFRIIRVFVRMGVNSSRQEERARGVDTDVSAGPSSSAPRRMILDAEFEDITPPKSTSEEPEKPQA